MPQQSTDPVRDGQPQAQPFNRLSTLLRQALELPKNLFVLIIGNPRAGVPHLNAYGIVLATAAEQDATVFGITNGIGQQVLQDSPQQPLIRLHHRLADHRSQT